MIIKKATLLHLRIPFSVYLMPVFLFAFSQSPQVDYTNFFLLFIILHLLVYPASNAYNSYYDKDEESIGGLEHPPEVSKELLYTSYFLDITALLLATLISWQAAAMVVIYGLASKAYSYDKVRLKKYPVAGWLTATFFQGAFTYLLVYAVLNERNLYQIMEVKVLLPAAISSLLIGGFYPMTQIYQHKEDAKRGDNTISRLFGIKGTFIFSFLMFLLADLGFFFYFRWYFSPSPFILLHMLLLPMIVYLAWWYNKVRKDPSLADFRHTMLLNKLGAISMISFFILFWLMYR